MAEVVQAVGVYDWSWNVALAGSADGLLHVNHRCKIRVTTQDGSIVQLRNYFNETRIRVSMIHFDGTEDITKEDIFIFK